MSQPTEEELKVILTAKAQAFLDKKYVARSDDRQKEMGLAYITAERQDLAKEMVNFILNILKEE